MEAIDVCTDLLFKHAHMESVDRETFKILAEIACCNTIFWTHDGFYIQKGGLAMGSPPAPHWLMGGLVHLTKLYKVNHGFMKGLWMTLYVKSSMIKLVNE